MARKKKALKDLKEHKNNTTTIEEQTAAAAAAALQDPNSLLMPQKKRNSFDENLLQQKQQQNFTQYQSDGELMELKQKLNLEKNKSNLFLIKSYSFIDKTNNKRPSSIINVKEKKFREFDKFQQQHNVEKEESKEETKEESKSKSKKSAKSKLVQKGEEKKEKPKKPPKLKKMKKSKSTHDSTENLEEFQELLRKPSVILEDEVKTEMTKRPQSLPVSQNQHRSVIKSKTLDDIETPRLKRDSFIRHSLQSIRRSFSSSKKHNNNINFISSSSTSSSSSSSCSNSSMVSDPKRTKTKTKDFNKDIGNLKDVEDSNYLIAVKEEDSVDGMQMDSQPCNVVITLNDAQTLETNSINTNTLLTPPYTMDPLAVLKEEDEKDLCSCFNPNNGVSCSSSNSVTSVNNPLSSLAQLPTDSTALSPMAPLQTHTECLSVQCLNTLDQDFKSTTTTTTATTLAATSSSSSSSPPQTKTKRIFQQQLSIPESLQSTSIGCATSSEYSSARSLKHSATSLTPLPSLNTSGSLRSISPSRRSASSSNSSSTAKHEQSTTAAAAAAAAAAVNATTSNGSTITMTTSSNIATATATPASAATATTPPEKEKKRKEISSSRVKKFHRHFAQVSKDEKLINYFSCALVSDILLQGHLYITDQHFAFYSNVFGYVTKVVIPTSSVTKISKEKTAKIIPNAVGVATADERHVFGSFISREAAFRLMCSVCPPLGVPEILPKDPASIEISEEYSIEDDSSCSISGNESPAQITELQQANGGGKLLQTNETTSQTLLRRSVASSNLSIADLTRHSDIPINAKSTLTANTASTRCSAPPATGEHYNNNASNGGGAVNLIGLKTVLQQQQPALKPTPDSGEVYTNKLTIIAGCASSTTSATSTPTPSTSSSPTTVMNSSVLSPARTKAKRVLNTFTSVSRKLLKHVKFPTEIHVVYLGVLLTLLLALFSIFLLYRILDIEAKTSGYRSPVEFNWRSGNDDDIFTEALRFQKQLQLKSTEEAQNILKTNLEQIAKVRRSLETLSMLIHDRSSSFVSTHNDDSD
ncbi:serine-rich adhesin for platelets-like [Lucilia cuprina]|uniref:serine-rich adhesin for platelets-like n=1 Tax=Lucilia cuprina TaxID=7375 RepID=UPI001F057337|nr:serine-rich adhesin for platelets-like [Lucilia cuprina]